MELIKLRRYACSKFDKREKFFEMKKKILIMMKEDRERIKN